MMEPKNARERKANEMIARTLIGKRIDDAEVTCETYNLRYRTVKVDGAACMKTNDARNDRVNFVVQKGWVTGAWIG
jgi:hypothetical protein